jgi:serine/threonine-protein phosphatase 2A regulatory subunit B'
LLESIHYKAPHKLSELLEKFGSIVNGLAVPLRSEHVQVLLQQCLLPLHTVTTTLATFFPQLAYCVVQFAEKDPTLSPLIISYLLRHWPRHHSLLQVLCLGEIEELMDSMTLAQTDAIKPLLFAKIAECIKSSHFQVAERALMVWSNGMLMQSVSGRPQLADMQVMVAALEEARECHWNGNVKGMALRALAEMSEIDPVMFAACQEKLGLGADRGDYTGDSGDVVMQNAPDDANTTSNASIND